MIEIRSRLAVGGDDLPFDEITALLGVLPTRQRRRHEFPVPGIGLDQWTYQIEGMYPTPGPGHDPLKPFPNPEVTAQFDQIRHATGDRVQAFAGWRRDRSVEIWLSAAIQSEDDDPPTMAVSSDFVPFAALMGAGLDFDIHTNAGPLAEAP